MFFLLGTLCEFPNTVLSNGIGDELLVLGHRRSDIGKSPIYGYANTLYLVWIWNGVVTPSYGIFVHGTGFRIDLACHPQNGKTCGRHLLDSKWNALHQRVCLFVVDQCSASWEFLFVWVFLIYCASSVLLVMMANCLKRLPIYEENLLQVRLLPFFDE